jgi:hypothetical protein
MLLLAAKTGTGSDADKAAAALAKSMMSGEKEGKKLTKGQKAQADQLKKSKEYQKAYDEAQERAAKKTEAVMDSLEGLSRATVAAANKLTSMVSSVANMGNSFSGAAGVLGQIPLVGGLIGPVFGAIGAAGDKVFNSFQQAASVGANFNGSIRTMVKSASEAGLTIDQFTNVIAKNGESLSLLGGNSADGAKRLSQLGKTINKSPIGDDLARLGYSTEAISNGMAGFSGRLAKTGALQGMTNSQLVASTGHYLKNLDAVSKLTGQSKDALQSEHDARMNNAKFMAMASKLDADSQANLHALMDTIPKQHQAGLMEIMSTGTATSEAGRQAMAFLNKTGMNAVALGQQMQSSGKLTRDQAVAFNRSYQQETKELAKSPLGETLSKYVDGANDFMANTYAVSGRTSDLGKTFEQMDKDLANAAKNKGKDPLDPAALQKMQQELAKTTNDFTLMLASRMPELQSAFTQLINLIQGPLMTAFNFMMDHIGKIASGVALFSGTVMALKAMFKGKELFDKLFGRGLGTKGNPMHVTTGGSGGLDDMLDGDGGDGKKGSKRRRGKDGRFRKATKLEKVGDFLKKAGPSAKTAGKLVKGSAVVGAAMSAYDAYDTFQDVDKQVAEGKMTEKEATKAKTVAGSKAAGTAAGGYGGAMAGAAIGTMIFPGVGTVIGGAIGGAMGAWGGEAAAGAAAEALTADQSGNVKQTTLSGDSQKKANDWAWSIFTGKNDMSQVPIGLRQSVADILKNPPGAWKKKLEGTISKPTAAIPKPPTASTDLSIAQKDMTKTIDDKNKAITKIRDIMLK